MCMSANFDEVSPASYEGEFFCLLVMCVSNYGQDGATSHCEVVRMLVMAKADVHHHED